MTNFLTNGWRIVAELDKEYNVRRRLVRGYGIVASEESSSNESNRYRFYHTNEHTDVVMLTNTEGNVINQYEYDAFGNYRSIREQEKNRYGYTGEAYDNLTDQYYLRARYYNPTIARFTQEDEYRGDGLNLYAYCGNNPVMYADPSGYKCKKTGVDNESGSIKYYDPDSLGRPTGIEATITLDMIATGTKANQSIIPPGFEGGGPGSPGHARGHLLGKQLGGSGDDPRNLVTLYQNPVNSPIMRDFETSIRNAVENGEVVNYTSTPIYNGNNLLPTGITMIASGSGEFNLNVTVINKK